MINHIGFIQLCLGACKLVEIKCFIKVHIRLDNIYILLLIMSRSHTWQMKEESNQKIIIIQLLNVDILFFFLSGSYSVQL